MGTDGVTRSLADILRFGPRYDSERVHLQRLKGSPWCWPEDSGLRVHNESWGTTPPAPKVGQACLVSVMDNGASSVLWALGENDPDPDSGEPKPVLVDSAARTAELAWLLAARDLPVLPAFRSIELRPRWRIWYIGDVGPDRIPPVLRGESFGLALFLASASTLLGRPVPADLVALAAIDVDGGVRSVHALAMKLKAVVTWAPGIKRVLLAQGQVEEAKAVLEELDAPLAVCGVAGLHDAAFEAFPTLKNDAFLDWGGGDGRARETLDRLYRQTLSHRSLLLGWRAIAGTAAAIRNVLHDDGEAVARADFVEAVAKRHDGEGDSELPPVVPWPDAKWLGGRPRPVRLRIVAHLLQSSTDGCAADLIGTAEHALNFVAQPGEEHAEDFAVLGAAGRAIAAVAEWDRALTLLERTICGLFEIFEADQASHALCEFLRVLGIRGGRGLLDEAISSSVGGFRSEPRANDTSQAFVTAAQGRALVQVGEPVRAIEALSVDMHQWELTPPHLRRSRLRWLARAYTLVGRGDEASSMSKELTALSSPGERRDPNEILADLDTVLASHGDVEPLLRELHDRPIGAEVTRILQGDVRYDKASAQLVAERWRY